MAYNSENITSITDLNLPAHQDIYTQNIKTSFGRANDFIDIFITDLSNTDILTSIYDYKEYIPIRKTGNDTYEIKFDVAKILKTYSFKTGAFNLHFNIQRTKIFNDKSKPFSIFEISSDRTELKVITPFYVGEDLDTNSRVYINEVQNSPILKIFNLNFGENINIVGTNLDIDKSDPEQYFLLIKLLNPLPNEIEVGKYFNLTEDLSDPFILTYDLGFPSPIDLNPSLRGPNFNADIRINKTIPSAFKSYNDILSTENTSSFQKLVSNLKNYDIPEIEYDKIELLDSSSLAFRSVTPTHFENFVHFGSAVSRLKTFKYKVELLESYNNRLRSLNLISGSTSQSSTVLLNTSSIAENKTNLLENLDGYERFLYYTTGSNKYTWPKITNTEPYLLSSPSSPEVKNWLGTNNNYDTTYYGGQLLSASIFDKQNQNKVSNVIPTHIGDKEENEAFLLFCEMLGAHFDNIWVYIKEIPEIRNSNHQYGVSKHLVYNALKNLGIEGLDQFENQDLNNYLFGSKYTTVDNATIITASNDFQIPKQDITKEIWKRLYHNVPYLLKTKGTERGLRALINCYGIPDTILDIKEYGSSDPNREELKLYTHRKFMKTLNGISSDHQGFFIQTNWSSSIANALSASAKTVEFRIKPEKIKRNPNQQYHLFSLSGSISSSDLHLILNPYTSSLDLYEDKDGSLYGNLELHQYTASIATSSFFKAYNGDFWDIFIGTNGTSGSDSTLSFGAYQSNYLREITYVTASVSVSEKHNAESFGIIKELQEPQKHFSVAYKTTYQDQDFQLKSLVLIMGSPQQKQPP